MTICISTEFDYIPECERDSANPCIVKIRYVSYAKAQEYSQSASARLRDGKNKAGEVWGEIQRKQFLDNVIEVKNFFVDGVEITNIERFYEQAPVAVVLEILKAMEGNASLSGDRPKNSE